MNDHPRYAIYSGRVSYHRELTSCDLASRSDLSKRCEGLPQHRIRDRSDWSGWIYRDDPGLDVVRKRLIEVWENYISDPPCQRSSDFVPRDPQDVEFLAVLVEHEEWVLTWFCHQTFDIGQSDEEVLASFERVLSRKGVRVDASYDPYGIAARSQIKDYCAMGAEDRRRWSGAFDDQGNRTPAPCRCEECKKAGMIRINH